MKLPLYNYQYFLYLNKNAKLYINNTCTCYTLTRTRMHARAHARVLLCCIPSLIYILPFLFTIFAILFRGGCCVQQYR